MKYVIKGKNRDTKKIVNCVEFRNKEPAQFCFEKLDKAFGKGYDFWIENQPGTAKTIKSYKMK